MNLLGLGLAFHQAQARSAMVDTATRLRPQGTGSDNAGGFTTGAVDTSLTFPCRLYGAAKTPLEQPQGGRVVAIMQWSMAAPVGTDLQPADQVQVSGRVFEVIDQDEKRTGPALLWVNLREVR